MLFALAIFIDISLSLSLFPLPSSSISLHTGNYPFRPGFCFSLLQSHILLVPKQHRFSPSSGAPPYNTGVCPLDVEFAATQDVPEACLAGASHAAVRDRRNQAGDERQPFDQMGERQRGESVGEGEREDGLLGEVGGWVVIVGF